MREIVVYAKFGSGTLGEAETNSRPVVQGWSVSWGQVTQGLEKQGQGVWASVERRQKSQDSAPRLRSLCGFDSLQGREARYPPGVCYALVVAVSLGLAFLLWKKKLSTHKGMQKNKKHGNPHDFLSALQSFDFFTYFRSS